MVFPVRVLTKICMLGCGIDFVEEVVVDDREIGRIPQTGAVYNGSNSNSARGHHAVARSS